MKHRIIQSSACGKFILLGEHFVVTASSPALAFPVLDFKTEVRLEPSEKDEFSVVSLRGAIGDEAISSLPRWDRHGAIAPRDDKKVILKMAEALNTIRPLFKATGLNFKVFSKTNIPMQKGFGSSASFTIAFSKALAQFVGDEREVLPMALDAIETLFHKTPSGVDTTTIFHEKPIRFEKGVGAQEIKNISADFILVDGGKREGCLELIAHVKGIRENDPKLWERLSGRMRNIVEAVQYSLASGDIDEVSYGIREAQDVLSTLKLSTERINKIISLGVNEGVLAGKVSGAGGGGAVVLVTRKGEGKEISERIKKMEVPVLAVVV